MTQRFWFDCGGHNWSMSKMWCTFFEIRRSDVCEMIMMVMSRVSDDFWINRKRKDTPGILAGLRLEVITCEESENLLFLMWIECADEGITGSHHSQHTTVYCREKHPTAFSCSNFTFHLKLRTLKVVNYCFARFKQSILLTEIDETKNSLILNNFIIMLSYLKEIFGIICFWETEMKRVLWKKRLLLSVLLCVQRWRLRQRQSVYIRKFKCCN